jgi:uracil-DNA glycosylase
MKINRVVGCADMPCQDIRKENYFVPGIEVDPANVSILLISEAAAESPADNYYSGPLALFARTTLMAFEDAGAEVNTFQEILDMGVYMTTAVKCGKTGYGLVSGTVEHCSHLLEQELALFPNVKAYLLMGDVAIKAVNLIAKRAGQPRVIPAGATYKIRGGEYSFRGARAFPSYVQAGPAFFVEKIKRKMIAEDIRSALVLAGKD